jgi:hypothetical protein
MQGLSALETELAGTGAADIVNRPPGPLRARTHLWARDTIAESPPDYRSCRRVTWSGARAWDGFRH